MLMRAKSAQPAALARRHDPAATRRIREHLRTVLMRARSGRSPSLVFTCRIRGTQFDSGIQASSDAIARMEHIAVRMQCPICQQMHLFLEKGELVEGD
jgi:hypothetical protein